MLPASKVSVGTSIVILAQAFSAAVFLAIGQVVFQAVLRRDLAVYAPTADENAILLAGVTRFRQVVQPGDLNGVLEAYNGAVTRVFVSSTHFHSICLPLITFTVHFCRVCNFIFPRCVRVGMGRRRKRGLNSSLAQPHAVAKESDGTACYESVHFGQYCQLVSRFEHGIKGPPESIDECGR